MFLMSQGNITRKCIQSNKNNPAFEFNKKPKHKKSERKNKSEICFMEISEVDPASSNHLSETSREIKQTVQASLKR